MLQVHFWTSDVVRQSAFYEAIGFEIEHEEQSEGAVSFRILRRDTAQLMIARVRAEPGDRPDADVWVAVSERIGGQAPLSVYIGVDELEAAWRAVQELGVSILEPLWTAPWGQSQLTVEDPDGHLVTLFDPAR